MMDSRDDDDPPGQLVSYSEVLGQASDKVFPYGYFKDPSDYDIYILRRREGAVWELCPWSYTAEELTHWAQVVMTFGGGCTYRLMVEHRDTGRIETTTDRTFPESVCKRRAFRPRKKRSAEVAPSAGGRRFDLRSLRSLFSRAPPASPAPPTEVQMQSDVSEHQRRASS